jgi:hypothetical protein
MCKKKLNVVSAAIVAVAAVVMLFPVMGTAGSLEPTAAPAPTMKTLDQIPPTWSQKIPSAQRFELVLDGMAVLDKETGLVWERTPSGYAHVWTMAVDYCIAKEIDRRQGWHAPTVEQLASLVDSSVAPGPTLPSGHPFTDVQSAFYWSTTTLAEDTSYAAGVFFNNSVAGGDHKTNVHYIWCVRGGQSHDFH